MSSFQLRQAARATAAELMNPAIPVNRLPDVPTVSDRLGLDPAQVHPKAQRYAVGGALTGIFMSELLVGDGRETAFRHLPTSWYTRLHPRRDPYSLFVYDMWLASSKARRRLVARGSPRRDRVLWLAAEYDRLTSDSPVPLQTNVPVLSDEIFRSSEGPYEVASHVLSVALACSRDPRLAGASPRELLTIAHDTSTTVIGRASSNVAAFTSRSLMKLDCARVSVCPRGAGHVLDTDGQFSQQPTVGAHAIISPTLKCLVHLVKKEPGDACAALQNFVHAGINAAQQRGLLDGDTAQRVWEQRVRHGWQIGKYAWKRPREDSLPTGL